jgi:GDP-fucose protein O-fucosyltransferase
MADHILASFVIPTITGRIEKDLSILETNTIVNFDSFFDLTHFRSTLQGACPQMQFYNHTNDLYDKPTTSNPPTLNPYELVKEFRYGLVLDKPNDWRPALDEWLTDQLTRRPVKTLSASTPLLVKIQRPVFTFPTTYDDYTFKNNFGYTLQPSPHIRLIVAKVLQAISSKYALDIDPSAGIHSSAYLGVHLRTRSDMPDRKPPSYTAQAPFYLSRATSHNLTAIYVASHNASDFEHFRSDAGEASGLSVTTAFELLAGDDLAAFQALTWDQKGLVDYQILSRASYFVGVAESTFSWSVAIRRHVRSAMLDFLGAANTNATTRLAFEDEWSGLVGETEHTAVFANAMWP